MDGNEMKRNIDFPFLTSVLSPTQHSIGALAFEAQFLLHSPACHFARQNSLGVAAIIRNTKTGMASNVPIATHQVVGASFGFFTTEEIRRLSVKRIDNPISLSRLSTPIEGGLYDPAMGPLDRDSKYVTEFEKVARRSVSLYLP